MNIALITLFPEIFQALELGITGRAIKNQLLTLHTWNPRDFTEDKHHTVDDRPYGGGPGMLMKVEPLQKAITAARQQLPNAKVIYLSPQGKSFNQTAAQTFSIEKELIFLCGRYEGIDERLIETEVDEQWSIGDYVLSGGEIPAMAIIDAIIRLLPGALGHDQSAEQDSFSAGLLDCPHYTRPEEINGLKVPEILLSGNHQNISRWRLKQSLGRTWLHRPDLLAQKTLTNEEKSLLDEFIFDYNSRFSNKD